MRRCSAGLSRALSGVPSAVPGAPPRLAQAAVTEVLGLLLEDDAGEVAARRLRLPAQAAQGEVRLGGSRGAPALAGRAGAATGQPPRWDAVGGVVERLRLHLHRLLLHRLLLHTWPGRERGQVNPLVAPPAPHPVTRWGQGTSPGAAVLLPRHPVDVSWAAWSGGASRRMSPVLPPPHGGLWEPPVLGCGATGIWGRRLGGALWW
uniref:Uncharacterized protein n=1 Tax=Anas platyrhynchos platyrhynchos TaxID=8840 RepID=A0A493T6C5_ANAPP